MEDRSDRPRKGSAAFPNTTRNYSGAFKTKKAHQKKKEQSWETERAFSASSLAFSSAIRVPFATIQTGFIGKDNACTAKLQRTAAYQAQETSELPHEPELSPGRAGRSGG